MGATCCVPEPQYDMVDKQLDKMAKEEVELSDSVTDNVEEVETETMPLQNNEPEIKNEPENKIDTSINHSENISDKNVTTSNNNQTTSNTNDTEPTTNELESKNNKSDKNTDIFDDDTDHENELKNDTIKNDVYLIYIECNNLPTTDVISKCDSFVKVSINENGEISDIGKTETIVNDYNPKYCKVFRQKYFKGKSQIFRFDVYESSNDASDDYTDHKLIGTAQVKFEDIISTKTQSITEQLSKKGKKITSKKELSQISIIIEKLTNIELDKQLYIKFGGKDLISRDKLSKNDSYFELYKKLNNKYIIIHKSECIENDNNPIWKECELKLSEICSNNIEKELMVKVYDKDKIGRDLVGECKTSWKELTGDDNMVSLIDADGADAGLFYVNNVDEKNISVDDD